MNEQEIKTKLSEAWKARHAGQNQVAIDIFKQIVAEAPDHIDASWGLALCYRAHGDRDNALKVFQKVKDLVSERLQTETDEREKYFMLSRMVIQQIEQMSDFI